MAENRINYQRELERVLAVNAGRRPRLLLHACCAPCASYVLEYLKDYFTITLYFYNQNMATAEEYEKRAEELKRLVTEMGLQKEVTVVVPPYRHADFLAVAEGLEQAPERGARCMRCFAERLEATAVFAEQAEEAFDYICTTLSISPLKDAEALNRIGAVAAARHGQNWLPSDFKKKGGYQRSTELSAQYALYRQNYCGCEFSIRTD